MKNLKLNEKIFIQNEKENDQKINATIFKKTKH